MSLGTGLYASKVGHMIDKRDPLRSGSPDDRHRVTVTIRVPSLAPGPATRSTRDRSTQTLSESSQDTPAVVAATTANAPACRKHQLVPDGCGGHARSRGWPRTRSSARASLVEPTSDAAPQNASRRGCRRRRRFNLQLGCIGRPCRRARSRRRGASPPRPSCGFFIFFGKFSFSG